MSDRNVVRILHMQVSAPTPNQIIVKRLARYSHDTCAARRPILFIAGRLVFFAFNADSMAGKLLPVE